MMDTQITIGGHVAIVLAIALLITLAALLIHRFRARRKARQAPASAPARHSRSGPVGSSSFDHSAGRSAYPASSSPDDSFPTPAVLWSRTSTPDFTGGGGEFSGAGASGSWDSPSCSSSSSSSCSSSSPD